MTQSHESLVETQFGARADAYLTSPVHAQGPDLTVLEALVKAHAGGRVLDMGCGGGHVSFHAAPHAREVVAYDLSSQMLAVVVDAARGRGLSNITTCQGPAEQVPFEDAAFDMVLSRYSTHHWRDFPRGLREAARVLKPGGMAVFIDVVAAGTPMCDTFFQAIELLRDPSHVRDYSRAEWETALAQTRLIVQATRRFRLRLDFASWVKRMQTSQVQIDAIRALQKAVSADVTAYFETEVDGSFTIDVALFEARKCSL